MMTVTEELLSKLEAAMPNVSDAARARAMKVTPAAMCFWKAGRTMGPDAIQRACDILKIPAETWLLRGLLETAKSQSLRKTLEKMRAGIAASIAFFAILLSGFSAHANMPNGGLDFNGEITSACHKQDALYIMRH